MTLSRVLLAVTALAALGGCVSFGPKPPKTLLTLSTSAQVPVAATHMAQPGNTITVLTPTATSAVGTVRIPVYGAGGTLSYVADVAWNEPPARALQRLMSETVTAKTGKVVLDPRQVTADPGMRLSGQVQRFGIDEATSEAWVVFDAQLARAPGTVETRRFEARRPVTTIDAANTGPALSAAANDVATQIATWIG